MNGRGQAVLTLTMIGLALGAVGLYSTTGNAHPDDSHSAGGHDHGAVSAAESQGPVRLTAEGARRIGVTYATAELRALTQEVRAVGNVSFDETRLANVDPKIEGWVERLHVDFTGAPVRRGQPLMEVYSPMLLSAQEELILARRLVDQAAAGGSERAADNARDLLESARRRLRYWDISAGEIAAVERSGEPRRTLTLTAPAGGVVVEKNVVQGSRVMPGMELYRIADLSVVWVEVDVFEKDLSLVRLGQHGDISFEAYPGERFEGLVRYVYPTVSADARTGRVRLELSNPGLRLKPGMYATVLLHLTAPREAVVVPRTAVLGTGQRSLVFVQGADGTLFPREVRVGLVSGDHVEVAAGLRAGEVVVSSASFLIDAESNLGASMQTMQGAEAGSPPVPAPGAAPAHRGHAGHE